MLWAFQTEHLDTDRTRIAILDTGFDPSAVFFNRQRKRRLQDWVDYVERNQPNPKDEDGHGTHVLSVLMKVAPGADVFVARVARDTLDLENSAWKIADVSRHSQPRTHISPRGSCAVVVVNPGKGDRVGLEDMRRQHHHNVVRI